MSGRAARSERDGIPVCVMFPAGPWRGDTHSLARERSAALATEGDGDGEGNAWWHAVEWAGVNGARRVDLDGSRASIGW
jgi:hypothetical protein